MKPSVAFTLLLTCSVLQLPVHAWDSVGHRLSAAVALSYLTPEKQQTLQMILRQHPRFQEDFLEAMPSSVQRSDASTQLQWLLGQAAYWPDIARGLPAPDAARFNRPNWHFTDGAWVRDGANSQGNVYILMPPFADIDGEPANSIHSEAQAHNIMTALDYNTRILADSNYAMADRAVALCWVLHLMGDIHQPLHAGSLFSPKLFVRGDRGGNAIATDDGNLHARWDRALADSGVNENLATILQDQNSFPRPNLAGADSDWSLWLAESRNLLLPAVYSDAMRTAIANADQQDNALAPQRLDTDYVNNMQLLSRQRLALAGLRIATWIENEL